MRDFNRNNRSNNRRGGAREMFDAVCDECGADCKVPFKPTGNKPIFCSHCFEKQSASDSRRNSRYDSRRNNRDFSSASASRRRDGRSHSREREMFKTICDECGADCEVPFKPSSDKPVYCSDCFAKKNKEKDRGSKGDNRNRGKGDDFGKQFKVINEKLDQILQSLSSTKAKKVFKKKVTPQKKVVAKKKAVKKKASPKKSIKKKTAKKKAVKKKAKKTTKKK